MTFGATTTIDGSPAPRAATDRRAAARRAEESALLAHRAGVAIAGGTDFGGGSTRANQLAWEVECLVAAGLEPWEALACGTWRGGELLGEPEAGVIARGRPGRLLARPRRPAVRPDRPVAGVAGGVAEAPEDRRRDRG